MKTQLVAVLAAALLAIGLSGCVSGPTDKNSEADDLDALRELHGAWDCTGTISGIDGIHAEIVECDASLKRGSRLNAEATFAGHNDNTGTFAANREASMTATIYYPGSEGNSVPVTVTYNVEKDNEETFTLSALAPMDSGFGDYELCVAIGGYEDAQPYWPGFQAKSDPTKPQPTCSKLTASKTGLF